MHNFKKDDKVKYIPRHAKGDKNHIDCEEGIVSSINDAFVFVRYSRNGILQQTAQATNPDNLILI